MLTYKSNLKFKNLIEYLQKFDDWYTDEGKVWMANFQGRGIPSWAPPFLLDAVQEIAKLRALKPLHLMLNKLDPGMESPKHRDWLPATEALGNHPCLERWHLPVICASENYWWDEDSKNFQLKQGYWHGPMPYWLNHMVSNKGKIARISVIVDLDSPIPIGEYT